MATGCAIITDWDYFKKLHDKYCTGEINEKCSEIHQNRDTGTEYELFVCVKGIQFVIELSNPSTEATDYENNYKGCAIIESTPIDFIGN